MFLQQEHHGVIRPVLFQEVGGVMMMLSGDAQLQNAELLEDILVASHAHQEEIQVLQLQIV